MKTITFYSLDLGLSSVPCLSGHCLITWKDKIHTARLMSGKDSQSCTKRRAATGKCTKETKMLRRELQCANNWHTANLSSFFLLVKIWKKILPDLDVALIYTSLLVFAGNQAPKYVMSIKPWETKATKCLQAEPGSSHISCRYPPKQLQNQHLTYFLIQQTNAKSSTAVCFLERKGIQVILGNKRGAALKSYCSMYSKKTGLAQEPWG